MNFTKLLRSFAKRDLAQFPEDENGDVLYRIWRAGADLSNKYIVDFNVIFPTKDGAESCAQKLASMGQTEVSYFDEKKSWDLTLRTAMVPSWERITRMERELDQICGASGGKNDGWGFGRPSR